MSTPTSTFFRPIAIAKPAKMPRIDRCDYADSEGLNEH
jgi:hypothetical protein